MDAGLLLMEIPTMHTIEALEARLRSGGIPIETWGVRGTATKTLENLWEEIQEKSATISQVGAVSCTRHSLCTQITYHPTGEPALILIEDRQIYPDTAIRKRGLRCLRETVRTGETFAATAARGIFEELDLLVDWQDIVEPSRKARIFSLLKNRGIREAPYLSEVYPELPTWRTSWHLYWQMPRKHFRKEGYTFTEKGTGITTYFTWDLMTEKETPPMR